MGLTALNLDFAVGWTLDRVITSFKDAQQTDSQAFSLSGAVNLAVFSMFDGVAYSITSGGGTQTFDLFSFTDLAGNTAQTFSANGVLSLVILPVVNDVVLSPGAANPLTWFFGGTTPTITIKQGGLFVFSIPAAGPGQTVDATHRNLTLTNNAGTTATGYFLALGG